MPSNRVGFAFSLLIAATGILGLIYIGWLWCSVANFADSQLRPIAVARPYLPPPGPIYLENDSYYWLSYAQRLAQGEDWRIRHTNMDGFPTGREVHWSQVISWSMVVFGKVRALFTHESLHSAVERASVAINPSLFALAAAGLFLALARRFGVLPAAVFTAFLVSLGDVGWTFQPLRPGHQGFHVVFGAASVVGLIFGGLGLTGASQEVGSSSWSLFRDLRLVNPSSARRWFLIAGVATGLALWVSATIESFFIYPMLGAVVVLLLLIPPTRITVENLSAHPDLWRLWGLTAGATGFLFYLLEYFPDHMAMRIEVNHPVYDLAVVGCGEFLRLLTSLRWGGRRATPALLGAIALALAVGILPVGLILFGPVGWHHMRDPQMLRLHNFIQEFYTYRNIVTANRLGHIFNLYGIIPLVGLLTPFPLLRRKVSIPQIMWLWCTFALAVSFAFGAYTQIRWMGFAAAALCLSALAAGHAAFGAVPPGNFLRRRFVVAAIVLMLLVQPTEFFRRQIADLHRDLRGLTIENELITPILNKRLAYALKASPDRPEAVIADPGLAPALGYFAGIPCLTSFYWENLDGLHDAVRFLVTKDPAEAHGVAVKTGATHVILPPGGALPNYFYYIAYGHYDTVDANQTFAARLLRGAAPMWIQPDIVLNLITTNGYSYRGRRVGNQLEIFRIQD